MLRTRTAKSHFVLIPKRPRWRRRDAEVLGLGYYRTRKGKAYYVTHAQRALKRPKAVLQGNCKHLFYGYHCRKDSPKSEIRYEGSDEVRHSTSWSSV